MTKVINVVGARPNFMKVAPIHRLMMKDSRIGPLLLHTGQHYDEKMSKVFFDELELPVCDVYLGVGSGSHAEQTARVMVEFEKVCLKERPDLVLVVGDVNSTLACAVVAAKLCIPVAHVEAGLRSGDRSMPEEINRLITDQISSFLFIHSPQAEENLLREGITPERIFPVGNVMIDSLVQHLPRAEALYERRLQSEFPHGQYGLVTLHRPSNVDDPSHLGSLICALEHLAEQVPLYFPVHPRTAAKIREMGGLTSSGLRLGDPVGYLSFLGLMKNARLVVTDSGGIQEETTFLNVPCVTARDTTERPITLELGSNVLAGSDPERILEACRQQLEDPKQARTIPLWDGRTAKRILNTFF